MLNVNIPGLFPTGIATPKRQGTRKPTPQKRNRATAPQGFHPTRGPRTPFRKTNRREYKRRKRARARSRR